MKNDKKIESLIKKIKQETEEFLNLPNQCAYSDRIVENIIKYADELKTAYDNNTT